MILLATGVHRVRTDKRAFKKTLQIVAAMAWLVAVSPSQAATALAVQQIAPGVYVHVGEHSAATHANMGAIANVGFIIGKRCVAVIDSGGSFAQGSALREAIKARTVLPICYVINTHVHPDHVYGNAAFTIDKPRFVGHRNLAASMAARKEYYERYLERTLGSEEAARSSLVAPDLVVTDVLELDLGGRLLSLRAWPTSHTDNDLTVFDGQTATLWLGDLVFTERVPVIDGKVTGWLASMQQLALIKAARAVPGHGAPGTDWPNMMVAQHAYLVTVRDGVRAALKARRSIGQASTEVGQAERGKWQLFDDFHAQNVTVAFTELEWED